MENRPVNAIQCGRRGSGVTYRLPQLRRPSIVQVAETAADQTAAPVSCPLLHRDLPLVASGSIHHWGRRRMPGCRRGGQRRVLPSVRRQKSGAPVCPAVHHPLRNAYPQRTVDARVMHCISSLERVFSTSRIGSSLLIILETGERGLARVDVREVGENSLRRGLKGFCV